MQSNPDQRHEPEEVQPSTEATSPAGEAGATSEKGTKSPQEALEAQDLMGTVYLDARRARERSLPQSPLPWPRMPAAPTDPLAAEMVMSLQLVADRAYKVARDGTERFLFQEERRRTAGTPAGLATGLRSSLPKSDSDSEGQAREALLDIETTIRLQEAVNMMAGHKTDEVVDLLFASNPEQVSRAQVVLTVLQEILTAVGTHHQLERLRARFGESEKESARPVITIRDVGQPVAPSQPHPSRPTSGDITLGDRVAERPK